MAGLFSDIGYGTPLFWALTAAAVCIVLIFAGWLIRNHRMRARMRSSILAVQQAASYSPEQLEGIKKLLANTGYAFDWEQNIYYSIQNPWQRALGYCSLYDDWGTPMGLVFDSEPVRFSYNGKRWLIEFWKGQYGITSGAEVGIYNTTEPDLDVPGIFRGTFYHCAADAEAMDMSFTLFRNGLPMFSRAERHWWLTGFALGEYCDPAALTLDATLSFEDPQMRDAFLDAIRKLGYTDDNLRVVDNSVRVIFSKPLSKQPLLRHGLASFVAMQRTRLLVASYKNATKGLENMYDILLRLQHSHPALFRLATGMGRQEELIRAYDGIRAHLG